DSDEFVKEFDRALAACKKLTKGNLTDPKYCASELSNGNTLPLALAIDHEKTGLAQRRFFEKVQSQIGELAKDDRKVDMYINYGVGSRRRGAQYKDGDIRLLVEREDKWMRNTIFEQNTIFKQTYCPHYDIMHSSEISMPELKKSKK